MRMYMLIGCLLLSTGCGATKHTVPNEALPAQAAWVNLVEACTERARIAEAAPCQGLPSSPIQSNVTGSENVSFWTILLGGLVGVAGVAAAVL